MKAPTGLYAAAAVMIAVAIAFDFAMVCQTRIESERAGQAFRSYSETFRQITAFKGARTEAKGESIRSPGSALSDTKATQAGQGAAVDPLKVIALNPELRSQYLKFYRASIDLHWGLVFKLLKLTPAQEERARDILTQLEANHLQVEGIAAAQGLDASDPQTREMENGLDKPLWSEAGSVLGRSGAADLAEYRREAPVYRFVQDLTSKSPDALTVDQAAQLIPILADASQKTPAGTVIAHTVDPDLVSGRAASVLNADQATLLDAILRKDQAIQVLNQNAKAR